MKLIIDIDDKIYNDAKNGYVRLSEIADAVLSGTPYEERKTGYWRLKAEWHNQRYYGCSVCGREIRSDELNIHIVYPKCPYCNADMKEKEYER